MDMTVSRWWAGVGAACALTALVLIPFAAKSRLPWVTEPPQELRLEMQGLTRVAGELTDAVRAYRLTQALAIWRSAMNAREARDTTGVRLDASVPASIGDAVRAVARDQWARLGPGASSAHAELFVYFDSSDVPTPVGEPRGRRSGRALESRRAVDVWFALPEATDGSRCVALVRLRTLDPTQVERLRTRSLLGPCGFYAAFGAPSVGVRAWLSATDFRAARYTDWDIARAPATDTRMIYWLGSEAARCLTTGGESCLSALRLDRGLPAGASHAAPPAPDRALVIDDAPGPRPESQRLSLGDGESHLLADMVRDLGRDRFALFWSAPSPTPVTAFAIASDVGIDTWTRHWLARTYGPPPARPGLRAGELAWLAVALPCLVAAAGRRRDRVLVERLRVRAPA